MNKEKIHDWLEFRFLLTPLLIKSSYVLTTIVWLLGGFAFMTKLSPFGISKILPVAILTYLVMFIVIRIVHELFMLPFKWVKNMH